MLAWKTVRSIQRLLIADAKAHEFSEWSSNTEEYEDDSFHIISQHNIEEGLEANCMVLLVG